MRENEKPTGARLGEAGFCILYLLTLVVFIFILKEKWSAADNDSVLNTERARYSFGFLLALLLLLGDSFHLVPRILVNLRGSIQGQAFFLGLGNIISSITMTLFYNILIRVGDSMEYRFAVDRQPEAYNLWVEQTILWLTVLRIILILLPQNRWFSPEGCIKWAWIRNVPFVLIGILTIIGYIQVIAHAMNYGIGIYVQIIIAVIFSFLTYLPVAIYGKTRPKLGMLMIPKTMCYVWILAVIAFG